MSGSCATSQRTPRPPTEAATAFASASFKSAHTTPFAPSLASRAASALPMPLAAPVTMQTLPLIFTSGLFHTMPAYGGTHARAACAGVFRRRRLRPALRARLAAVALAGRAFRRAKPRLRPHRARHAAAPRRDARGHLRGHGPREPRLRGAPRV